MTILSQIVFLTPTKNHQHPSQLQPNKKIIEMLIVFHKEMKVVNKEHQSILDLKLPFRNYDARIAFVCFEVPCCFEVHIPVISCLNSLIKNNDKELTKGN